MWIEPNMTGKCHKLHNGSCSHKRRTKGDTQKIACFMFVLQWVETVTRHKKESGNESGGSNNNASLTGVLVANKIDLVYIICVYLDMPKVPPLADDRAPSSIKQHSHHDVLCDVKWSLKYQIISLKFKWPNLARVTPHNTRYAFTFELFPLNNEVFSYLDCQVVRRYLSSNIQRKCQHLQSSNHLFTWARRLVK